jgi:hypothetical protein
MRKISSFLFWIGICAFLSACTVYQNVPIEVLRLSEVILPKDSITRVAFLYRNFKAENDTFQNYFRENDVRKIDLENEELRYSRDYRERLAITACYNLALACEIKDKLDLAKDWINQGFRSCLRM